MVTKSIVNEQVHSGFPPEGREKHHKPHVSGMSDHLGGAVKKGSDGHISASMGKR